MPGESTIVTRNGRVAGPLFMASNAGNFRELLQSARAGDSAALDELARIYESDLRIAARVHLGPALRPYLDSIDLVQSVHRSLIRGLRDEKFDLDNSAALIALALTMVRRKVARQWRRHRRQQRLDGLSDTQSSPDLLATLTARAINPPGAAEARESMARVCESLDDIDRKLLDLRLQGWSTAEVAKSLGQLPEALRIRLYRLRRRLASEGVTAETL